MSMNMMEILKGQLGGMVAGQLGKSVGLDSAQAKAGVGALLPTILGGLIKQSSTPEGAGKLNDALDSDDYDGGLLDNLSGMLTGGDTGSMSKMGGGAVEMLFGNKVGAIADIIGKVTGMKSGSAAGLLAILAPLVMSYLGKQKRSLGLDSGGMANLLMSQKDEVAKEMPAGMSSTLGLTSLGFADTPAGRPAATPSAPPAVSSASSSSGSAASGSSSSGGLGLGKILIPLLIVAALAFGAFQFLGGSVDSETELPKIKVGGAGMADAKEVTTQLKDVADDYTKTLTSITDVKSAETAVPEMEDLNDDLDDIAGLFDQLPASIKESISPQITSMLEPIQAMLDKVMAIPGVDAILKPVVDNMQEKVSALTAA